MNLEQFKKKYEFAVNMTDTDIKRFLIFLMGLLLDMSLSRDREGSKMEEIFEDIRMLSRGEKN